MTKRILTMAIGAAMGGLLVRGVAPAWGVQEDETNDQFDAREILDPDVREVTAELGSGDPFLNIRAPNINIFDSLYYGVVDFHTRSGYVPGTPYVALIDNQPFGGGLGPDTVLGSFGEGGQLYAIDEDSSPLGNGRASALVDYVNNDGSVRFRVTGTGDYNFDGDIDGYGIGHLEIGEYVLKVYFNVSAQQVLGDVGDIDYFTFTCLTPGATFTADITSIDDLDTTLFWVDDESQILAFNDNKEVNLHQSRLDGTVPASGEVNLVVSGYRDYDLRRGHGEHGAYVLTIEETSSILLGDMDGDGELNAFDVAGFELALADVRAYLDAHPGMDPNVLGDFDASGALDAFDVDGFEAALASAGVAAPEPASIALLACTGLAMLSGRRRVRIR